MQLGIDFGSISIGAVCIKDGKVVETHYLPHKGDITGSLQKIVSSIHEPVQICVTGKDTSSHKSILRLDSIVAITDGSCALYPDTSHIVAIGGESYTLIHLKNKRLQNYLTNTSCASGTGAFLEQQASRLGMDITTFAQCAARFQGTAPRVATRCAVFAKSDIIHLQQDGVTVDAIAAGLCDSLVDGLVESLFKGLRLGGSTVIAGGVALNARVVQTLSVHLENPVISQYAHLLGAYGAALYAQKADPVSATALFEIEMDKKGNTREALMPQHTSYPDFDSLITQKEENTEITVYQKPSDSDVYLGIDIGSTSTKAVITSRSGEVLLGFYTRTAGKPVDAVKCILRCIRNFCEKNSQYFHFMGVGTTGSGRKLIKNVLHADLEVNEITAHARAATFLYPEVDTIIEIGGQDAKFTRIAHGTVTNAVMNYVCAAGTGSFLEEQAKRLNIPLENFSSEAMKGTAPITSERCTVYMERDINRLIRQGWNTSDIAAAVIYSVRDNYLNKVVAGTPIGDNIIFQGATARNRALVVAFEQFIQKPIRVFPYAHLTGALGVCLLLKEQGFETSHFKGVEFADMPVSLITEHCALCNNHCKLTVVVTSEGKEAYGMMCGRDYAEKRYVPTEVAQFNFLKQYTTQSRRGTVVIPCALAMYEYLPLWRSFFQRLGFEVRIVKTNQRTFERGKQIACAEFCAPLLTAQGVVWDAACSNAEIIFFPIFYKEAHQGYGSPVSAEGTPAFFCYYTSHLPAIIQSRLPEESRHKLVAPLLSFDNSKEEITKELSGHLVKYGVDKDEVVWAYEKAHKDYLDWKKENIDEGKKILSQISKEQIGLVILGRPYNTFDPTMNAALVEKIIRLGYPTIYYDMLEIQDKEADTLLSRIHWNYGKKIYQTAKFIAESENLFPIYLTSFRCSPDAFIMTYFKYLMDHFKKPYLIIQLDEHCSDVGYITRVEAAIDSFKNWHKEPATPPILDLETNEVTLNKTILIPHVDEIAAALVAAAFKSYGYKAIVLEESSSSILHGFRHTLGGECMAVPAILGGIIKAVKKYNLDTANTVVFLPTSYISCNFPQFPVKIGMALEKEGMGIKVINTGSFNLVQRLLFKMDIMLWDILIISHAIRQMGNSIRPYELRPGETNQKIAEALKIMEETFEQKKNKGPAWEKVISLFQGIKIVRTPRPKILVTGDMYVKNNDAFNQNIVARVEDLGGEVISSSISEYFHYGIELDRYEGEQNWSSMATYYVIKRLMDSWEQFYYKPIQPLVSEIKDPSWDDMFSALTKMGVDVSVHGETALTISRALCLAQSGQIDAIVHVNPAFCCAGNVSAALLESIREKLSIPILNIFYDGTDQPNNTLVPFMYYICQQKKESQNSRR